MNVLPHSPTSVAAAEAARYRLKGIAVRTPLVHIETDSRAQIYLKLENLQPIGSFKIRGAGSKLMKMGQDDLREGVWTASAGNMAQGVAWCARRLDIPFTAVVPDSAPEAKTKPIERLGGRLRKLDRASYFDIYTTRQLSDQPGLFVHAFSDSDVMAGNATIALEIIEDLPDVEAIYVPYGGGGLSCGIGSIMRERATNTEVIACEPATAAPLAASLEAGQPTEVPFQPTFIDGAGAPHVFPEMFALATQVISRAVPVSVEDTAAATRLLAERAHVIAEGAGALALAAALNDDREGPVVCVVSGGNIDPDVLAAVLQGRTPA